MDTPMRASTFCSFAAIVLVACTGDDPTPSSSSSSSSSSSGGANALQDPIDHDESGNEQ